MELGVLFVGLVAGVMSGLFGIGGGIVMVPVLIAFFGMDMLNANATSLAAMLLPVGIFGVINYYKSGLINIRKASWIAVGLLIGSFFGAEIAVSLSEKMLSKLYSIYLLYISIVFLNIPALIDKYKRKTTSTEIPKDEYVKEHKAWAFVSLGSIAGLFAGLFGKGGGLVIGPALQKRFHFDPKMATATSLAALQLPVGLPSVLVYARDGYLNFTFAGLMALGILIGVFFGSKLALNLPSAIFKKVYALFLVVIALYVTFKYA